LSVDGPADLSTGWQTATVEQVIQETANAKTFRLALSRPTGHRAGQHYVLRLTAPDGYTASRSYSVASAPGDPGHIDLTVERLADGEVSSFLHDVVIPGDELEVRGPIGGWFSWDGDSPALLVGGGSGVVPLMSMLRLARLTNRTDLVHLVVSVRTAADLYYRDELPGDGATVVYTRESAGGATARPPRRLTDDDLAPFVRDGVTAFVCGSSGFADAATGALIRLGVPSASIRVERFGPTG
jgi:ferredoxin-NADP reductase